MKRVITEFYLTPDEILDVLEAHSCDVVLKVVSRYRIAAGFNPDQAILSLWVELQKQFGTSAQIAKALQHKLNSLPPLGSDIPK